MAPKKVATYGSESSIQTDTMFPGNSGTGTAAETNVKRRKKERKIARPSNPITSAK
jgi:hypothetical protein